MLTADLDYYLPPELIAQQPAEPRDSARLLVLNRHSRSLHHSVMSRLPSLLREGDLLVLNDSRVLRARLKGIKRSRSDQPRGTSGGAGIEMLLLREKAVNFWEVLLKPSVRIRVGTAIDICATDGSASAWCQVEHRLEETWMVRFDLPNDIDIRSLLPRLGEVPLPHYIHRQCNETHYQTVFARSTHDSDLASLDSVAAPTAGLHFTSELITRLENVGIRLCFLTLAVGVGTFRPVRAACLEDHIMHEEEYEIPVPTAKAINEQLASGGRVVAVGTTSTRALESAMLDDGTVAPGAAATRLFIQPGFRFRCVKALLTNFHLPRSSLLSLVAAFVQDGSADPVVLTGLTTLRYAYSEAIKSDYRFFSFGDALLIE